MSTINDQTGATACSFDGNGNFGGSTGLKNIISERKVTLGDITGGAAHIIREFVFSEAPTGAQASLDYNDDVAPVGSFGHLLGGWDATLGKFTTSVMYRKKESAVPNTSSGFTAVTQA